MAKHITKYQYTLFYILPKRLLIEENNNFFTLKKYFVKYFYLIFLKCRKSKFTVKREVVDYLEGFEVVSLVEGGGVNM